MPGKQNSQLFVEEIQVTQPPGPRVPMDYGTVGIPLAPHSNKNTQSRHNTSLACLWCEKQQQGPVIPVCRSRGDPAFGGTHRRTPGQVDAQNSWKFLGKLDMNPINIRKNRSAALVILVDVWRFSDWIGWYPNICPKSDYLYPLFSWTYLLGMDQAIGEPKIAWFGLSLSIIIFMEDDHFVHGHDQHQLIGFRDVLLVLNISGEISYNDLTSWCRWNDDYIREVSPELAI